MIIYKPTDRIPIKVGALVLTLAPLTFEQKKVVFSDIKQRAGKQIVDETQAARKALKYSVKDLSGAKDWSGSEFKLKFDNQGNLLDSSIDALMGLGDCGKIMDSVAKIMNNRLADEVEGVEIIRESVGKKKKRHK